MTFNIRQSLPWLGLMFLLGTTWFAYAPGLSGSFQFDDFVNLDALGATGPVQDWPTFWRYITSGNADPTGRPLALLSFLVDARDWPADPGPFLTTNVLLHLINGALLFGLLRQLGAALTKHGASNELVALLGTSLWLMHPLFVSTTLYIVQREAMLPATFTLLGLLVYGSGRQKFQASAGSQGLRRMWVGIGAGTVLAMLCKGNGILLPLLAGTLEYTVWRHSGTSDLPPGARVRLRRTLLTLLLAPSLLVLAYLCLNLPHLHDDLPSRPWTIAQRLLTQPRVILDYLQLLAIPRSMSTGLYNDAYPISTGLLVPLNTLPALVAVGLLIAAALRYRNHAPRLSAALLFFFAGHALESTTIPLEIYFEHRNYLPAVLLFWPLANAIVSWRAKPIIRGAIASLMLALLFFTTHARSELWGRPAAMAQIWALQNPDSSRAQATAAMALLDAGEFELAEMQLKSQLQHRPYDLQLALNFADAACRWRRLDVRDKTLLRSAFQHAEEGALLIHHWLGKAIDAARSGQCAGLTLADVADWIDASASNPQVSRPEIRDQTIEPLRARLAVARKKPDLALLHFNRALLAFTTPDAAARFVAFLASAGYYDQALAHLDFYEQRKASAKKPGPGMPRLHAKVLEIQSYWPREMMILRCKLKAEIAAQSRQLPVNAAIKQ